jgi:hypothetical protein
MQVVCRFQHIAEQEDMNAWRLVEVEGKSKALSRIASV